MLRPASNLKISENFREDEFQCRCCHRVPDDGMEKLLLIFLEKIRLQVEGASIALTSGFRCPGHNAAVDGAPSSQHLLATAGDITAADTSVRRLWRSVKWVALRLRVTDPRFRGIGFGLGYYKNRFVHVDVRRNRARWRG